MKNEQLQKLINDFGQLLNGNSILLEAYRTIINELQNREVDNPNENSSSN